MDSKARRQGGNGRRLGMEALEERRVLAADFELLADMTTTASSFGSQPTELTRVGEIAFFVAWTETTGAELWKTDGTATGTVLVKDIYGGRNGSAPSQLTNVNGTLYFMANDGVNDAELWKSDGTAAGTERLSTTATSNLIGPSFAEIVAVGNSVYFTAGTASNQTGLWKTDGTTGGTMLLQSFFTPIASMRVQQLTEMNGALYFFANDGTKGMELWKSDGTTDGTTIVKDIISGSVGAIPALSSSIDADLVNAGGTLYFSATSLNSTGRYDLWKSDGTAAGTVMLKSAPAFLPGFAPQHFFEFNGNAYFVANDGTSGWELWKSDGTAAGTMQVKDIGPGFQNGMATEGSKAANPQFTVQNGQLYLIAASVGSRALWRTDGTAAGTTWVAELPIPHFPFDELELTSALGKLFLVGGDDDVYASDGQSTTWQKLAQLDPAQFSTPNLRYAPTPEKSFLELGSRVLFSGATWQTGAELWSTDGSVPGTSILVDISIHGGARSISRAEFAGSVYLAAGGKLWKSDGTPGGTLDVTEALAGAGVESVGGLQRLGDRLYFRAQTDETGQQFWTTDGTQAGTWRLTDIHPPNERYSLNDLTLVGETLYFTAHDETDRINIWQSDGTVAGTSRVEGFVPNEDERPTNFTAYGDALLFEGEDDLGNDLWIVQGGVAQKLYDFIHKNGGETRSFTGANGQLFFTADDRLDGKLNRELWKTDGTSAGTVKVKEVSALNSASPNNLIDLDGTLYFTTRDDEYVYALWRSDGTEAGTYRVAGLRQSGIGIGIGPSSMREVNGVLYFTADDGVNGSEIWRSDGTTVGTYRLTDLGAGPSSGFPTGLANVYGTLYFSAYDEVHGEELWKSDGTSEGTVLMKEFVPGTGNSGIGWIGGYFGGVMVAATTPEYGQEVWTMMPESEGDYTGDGATDGADFLAWQRGFGAAASPAGSGADGDGNGTIGSGDLAVWKAGFGTGGNALPTADSIAIIASELSVASLTASEEVSALADGHLGGVAADAADAAFAWLAADRTAADHGSWKRSTAFAAKLLARDHAARASSLAPSARNELGGDWNTSASVRKIREAEVSLGAGDAMAAGEDFSPGELDESATGGAFRTTVR